MRIVDRGAKIVILGDEADAHKVGEVLREFLRAIRGGYTPTLADVEGSLRDHRKEAAPEKECPAAPVRDDMGISPRTAGQRHYLETISEKEMTFVIGPAGTGKTSLAMAAAVSALLSKRVERLVLTRPAVEAGESLGFLPGDLEQKVNPKVSNKLFPSQVSINAALSSESAKTALRDRVEEELGHFLLLEPYSIEVQNAKNLLLDEKDKA